MNVTKKFEWIYFRGLDINANIRYLDILKVLRLPFILLTYYVSLKYYVFKS